MAAAAAQLGPATCVDLSVVQEYPKYGPGTTRSLASAFHPYAKPHDQPPDRLLMSEVLYL